GLPRPPQVGRGGLFARILGVDLGGDDDAGHRQLPAEPAGVLLAIFLVLGPATEHVAQEVAAIFVLDGAQRVLLGDEEGHDVTRADRKSTRLNSSHVSSSYAVFCLKTKKTAESRWSG